MKNKTAQNILLKVKKDYSNISSRFSETRKKVFWQEGSFFDNYIKEGDKVLDLGCGNGRLYEFLRRKSIDYTGVDNSKELIKEAKKIYSEDAKHRFVSGDALDFDHSQKYDVVFLVSTLHHIPSNKLRQRVIHKVVRSLNKDGRLIMINWNLFQKKYFPYILKNIFSKIIFKSKLDFFDAFIPWKNFKSFKNYVY